MANNGNDTTPANAGVNAGVEEVQRVADDDRSVKESKAGEALAAKLGISIEELDRRLQSEDKQRDAAGLPPLPWSQIADRAALDDFAPDPGPPSKQIHDTPGKDAGQQDEAAPGKGKSAGRDPASGSGNQVEDESREREREAEELRLARETRQREALQAVTKQFNAADGNYYDKNDRTRLVFADQGSKLVAFNSEASTAKAVAMMAEGKGWSTIKVGGTDKFKREVWLEASLRGVQVQGFKPKETDLAALQERREQTATNKVYQVNEPEKPAKWVNPNPTVPASAEVLAKEERKARDMEVMTKKWLVQEKADNGLYTKDVLITDDAKAALSAFLGDKNRRVIDNKLNDYAADYVLRENPKTGERSLEADYHKRSSFAQEAGVDRTPRSDKGKVVEAVASAAVTATVQNPTVREKVMQEVNRQLDKRQAEGRVPTVQVYDAAAPAKPREQAPVVQRDREKSR